MNNQLIISQSPIIKNELIIVEQLPIIKERLEELSQEVDNKISNALVMQCSLETIKEIKSLRAELNKDYSEFESVRKAVKTAILNPYNDFEDVYKSKVSDKFKKADETLKGKIDLVENEIKKKTESEVKSYFNEYCQSKAIDFLSFEQTNIKVTLSASKKSLKTAVKNYIDKIADDLSIINAQQFYKDEILYEYKQTLNCSRSINVVNQRKKAMAEALQNQKVEKEQVQKAIESDEIAKYAPNNKTVPLQAPVIEMPVKQERISAIAFKVKGTREQLKELYKFLKEGGYCFDEINPNTAATI